MEIKCAKWSDIFHVKYYRTLGSSRLFFYVLCHMKMWNATKYKITDIAIEIMSS